MGGCAMANRLPCIIYHVNVKIILASGQLRWSTWHCGVTKAAKVPDRGNRETLPPNKYSNVSAVGSTRGNH